MVAVVVVIVVASDVGMGVDGFMIVALSTEFNRRASATVLFTFAGVVFVVSPSGDMVDDARISMDATPCFATCPSWPAVAFPVACALSVRFFVFAAASTRLYTFNGMGTTAVLSDAANISNPSNLILSNEPILCMSPNRNTVVPLAISTSQCANTESASLDVRRVHGSALFKSITSPPLPVTRTCFPIKKLLIARRINTCCEVPRKSATLSPTKYPWI